MAGRAPHRGADLPGRLLAELAGLAVDDPSRARLRARVIEWYLPMAVYLARRFGGRGELLDDLTQVAAVGLIKAVDRFDPVRGVDFASYAVPTMVGEIRRHFRDTTWAVRVPRRLQELKLQLPAATEELLHVLHRAPATAELAERLGISPGDMVSAQLSANAYRPFSIDRGSSSRPDLRPEDWLGGPDPELDAVDNRTTLRILLARLPIREQRILAMRFAQDMTQTQIAAAIGISQMHVSRLLLKSLAQLHEALTTEPRPSSGQATGGRRRRPPTTPTPTTPTPAPARHPPRARWPWPPELGRQTPSGGAAPIASAAPDRPRPGPWRPPSPSSTILGVLIMQTVEAEAAVAQRDPPTTPTAVAVPRRGSQYAVLLRQVKQAGLLDRRTRYYLSRIAVTTVLLAGGWLAFVLVGDSWWQLAVAAFLAIVFTQVGFLAHDAGHKQIFTGGRANDTAGILLGNLAVGLGYGFWVDNHNRHHAHPNTDGKDPDIDFGALAFTAEQAGGRGRFARLAYRYQAYFFFPLPLLTALSLHVDSAVYLARRTRRSRTWERVLFAAHVVGYLAVVFWVLSPVKAAVFIVVQQGLLGLYLGVSFAPNHKGMPILAADDASDFLRRQVLTSRNVHGGPLVDAALGALNYQIEYHLFPSMPRPNLRRAQPIIARFCRERGLPYVQTSLLDSYAQTLRHLHAVGRHPKPNPP